MTKFQERLNYLIEKHNTNGNRVAIAMGIHNAVIGNWQRGLRFPNGESVIMICKHFDVSADWLLGLETSEEEDRRASASPVRKAVVDMVWNMPEEDVLKVLEYASLLGRVRSM